MSRAERRNRSCGAWGSGLGQWGSGAVNPFNYPPFSLRLTSAETPPF